jgi:hypothetical protein
MFNFKKWKNFRSLSLSSERECTRSIQTIQMIRIISKFHLLEVKLSQCLFSLKIFSYTCSSVCGSKATKILSHIHDGDRKESAIQYREYKQVKNPLASNYFTSHSLLTVRKARIGNWTCNE